METVLSFNNRFTIQWGHYKYEHTYPSHSGSGFSFTVNFPITFSMDASVTACVRNNTQFCVGVQYVNNSRMNLGVQSHSNASQAIYGVFWTAVGST